MEFQKVYEINIAIKPIAKARARYTKRGITYTPKRTRDFEKAIAWAFKSQCDNDKKIIGKAVKLEIKFYFKYPKADKRKEPSYHTKKPDLDNLIKSITDALNGLAFADDRQIAVLTAIKQYTPSEPSIIIRIYSEK